MYHIGTSAECPICAQGPEDIKHPLFVCQTVKDLWSALGLQAIIEEAMQTDRAGSGMLETLLRMETQS
jgi:hypothetical protein